MLRGQPDPQHHRPRGALRPWDGHLAATQLKEEGESDGTWGRAPGLLLCGLSPAALVPTQPGFRTTLGRSTEAAATGGLEAVASVQTRTGGSLGSGCEQVGRSVRGWCIGWRFSHW